MSESPSMSEQHLNYLTAINEQIGGPIRSAVEDRMTQYIADCVYALSTRVLVDIEVEGGLHDELRLFLSQNYSALTAALNESKEGAGLSERIHSAINAQSDTNPETLVVDFVRILIERGGDEAERLVEALVETDANHWREREAAALSIRTDVSQRIEREIDALDEEQRTRLLDLLREQCGESQHLDIEDICAVPGGFSKQTIIVTLRNNEVLPKQIVIRRDRADSPVGTTVADEMELLTFLYQNGIRVPKPWVLSESRVMDMPVLVVSKVEGRNIGDVYTIREKREDYALDLANELAKLHKLNVSDIDFDVPGSAIGNEEFIEQEIGGLVKQWRELGESSIIVEASFQWLLNRLHLAEGPRALIHRDPRFHNILCRDDRITAVLDWELAMIGHPARDLGWAYHHVIQLVDWNRFVQRYEESGGPQLSSESLAFYALWSDLHCAVQMYRARAAYHAGHGSVQYAFAGEEMRQQNMHIVAERLQQVMKTGTLINSPL